MKVKIKSKGFNMSMPIPVRLASSLVRLIPEAVLVRLREEVPEPYNELITKQNLRMLIDECVSVLVENKGLEIVNVEAADGTLVYIRL